MKYEDLVTRPKEMALKMYTFMGVEHLVQVNFDQGSHWWSYNLDSCLVNNSWKVQFQT